MRKVEELKSINFDLKNNIFQINGRDVEADEFMLQFRNGMWEMEIHEHRIFSAGGRPHQELVAKKDELHATLNSLELNVKTVNCVCCGNKILNTDKYCQYCGKTTKTKPF